MTLRSESGEKLYKRIELKIFAPLHDKPHVQVIKAEPRTGFGKQYIADILAAAALEIADAFPAFQYRLIERGPNQFTFVPTGTRVNTQESAKASA